jgi:hypothetical protein
MAIMVVSAGCVPSPDGGHATLLPVRDDVVDLRPVALESMRAVGGSEVEAQFLGGPSPCTAVGRVDVDETPSSVTVTVWVGTPADQQGTVCSAVLQRYAVRAPLASPLGDRALLDGSLLPT